MYKLRIYHTSGNAKGMLKNEEFFNTIEELNKRYNELFKYELYSLNPTAWVYKELIDDFGTNYGLGWCRLSGY